LWNGTSKILLSFSQTLGIPALSFRTIHDGVMLSLISSQDSKQLFWQALCAL